MSRRAAILCTVLALLLGACAGPKQAMDTLCVKFAMYRNQVFNWRYIDCP